MSKITQLNTFNDGRGIGVYNVFPAMQGGQINVSETFHGVIRAFHKHNFQTDYWFCLSGNMHVVLVTPNHNFDENLAPRKEYYERDGDLVLEIDHYDSAGDWEETELLVVGKVEHHFLSEKNPKVLEIPPGTYHGYKTLENVPSKMLYYTNRQYNPNDEIRLDYDAFGYDIWEVKNC